MQELSVKKGFLTSELYYEILRLKSVSAPNQSLTQKVYWVFILTGGFLIPLILTIGSYCTMLQYVKRVNRDLRNFSSNRPSKRIRCRKTLNFSSTFGQFTGKSDNCFFVSDTFYMVPAYDTSYGSNIFNQCFRWTVQLFKPAVGVFNLEQEQRFNFINSLI